MGYWNVMSVLPEFEHKMDALGQSRRSLLAGHIFVDRHYFVDWRVLSKLARVYYSLFEGSCPGQSITRDQGGRFRSCKVTERRQGVA